MVSSTALRISFLATVTLAGLACSSSQSPSEGSNVRSVSGALKVDKGITQVVAVEAGGAKGAKTFTTAVDGAGRFTLSLPIGKRYMVSFKSGTQAVGVLGFKDGAAGTSTSLLPVAHGPTSTMAGPKAEGSTSNEAEDDIDLGDVDDADGDAVYEPSKNPLDEVDSDDDGESDLEDADDDDDGTADVEDADDDNNGTADVDEEQDSDQDGVPDDADDADDDGTPDD